MTVEQLASALGSRYRIQRELGQGGMAVVYLADDLKHERSVAIKVLRPEIARVLGAARFLNEIRTTAGLAHPHILPLHDSGEAGGLLYYVMPFVAGESLRQRLDRDGALPMADAFRITREVADALGYAHQRQVLHRDIKPENILLADGHAFVADFGIARALRNTGDARLTRTGTSIGTPAYMSPEQAFGERSVDARSDLYSLACVVYEMVTGHAPWAGQTAEAVLVKRFTTTPPRLPTSRSDLPVALDDALQRALARDPDDRFPSAAEFLAALDPVVPAGPVSSAPAARQAPAGRATVGRDAERAELRSAFDSARQGRGLLFCVSGEPGIGKTTFVEEVLAQLATEQSVTIARGRCSERLAGTDAYLPHLEALEGLLRTEGPECAQAMRDLAPTWYAQVAVQPDTGERAALQREMASASQERMKRELGAFVAAMARLRPLVLFIDDLHWADVSTVDLLSYLAGRFPDTPVLVVVTYRTSDLLLVRHPFLQLKPDLQSRGLCRELELAFLTLPDIVSYLALQFPGHRFPKDLAPLILAKTEGSPLFMADLVRYLRDNGVIRAEPPAGWVLGRAMPDLERVLPESVRGMIERKIGQLQDEDRTLLVAASVQGYEFDSAVVAKALGREPLDIEVRLEELERAYALVRMVEEHALPDGSPSLRFRFVHALYQNALYATLRATRRTRIHTAVAGALEALWAGQTTGVAQELAMLWEGAREPARAAGYLLVAARQAFDVHANHESAALATRGIALLGGAPESRDRDRRELALQVAAGGALRITRGYGEAEVGKAYRRAALLSERARDDSQLVAILRGLWEFHELRGEYGVARDFARELFTFADRRKDPALLIVAHDALGDTSLWTGDLRAARRHLERGAELYDRAQPGSDARLFGYDSGVACLSFLALALWYLGYPDQALRRSDQALALAQRLGTPAGLAQTMFFAAWVHQLRGDAGAARTRTDELITLSEEQGIPMYLAAGRLLRGLLLAGEGRADEGLSLMREGIAGHLATGTQLGASVWSGAWLAEGLFLSGRVDEAVQVIADALAFVERTGERFHEAELWRLRAGGLRRRGGSVADADAALRRALASAQQGNAKSLELRAAIDLVRARRGHEGSVEAGAELARVCEWFGEGRDTRDLIAAKDVLASS